VEQRTQDTAGALTRIVREHRKAVFAVAYAKLRNSHDAEDITQDVFVEVYRNAHKLKNVEKVATWLYKATVYRCIDHVRKTSRREKREATFMEFALAEPPPDPQIEDERYAEVVRAIDRLPDDMRVVIMLKHFAGLSYDDISKMTGLSKTTIDGRLRTGKKRLRQRLGEIMNE
jgi:RNA polymerase sigma-70 factor (ECF subfamily)